LLLGNNALFAVWTFAILRAGGIVLPVNLRLHAAEVGAILSDAAPSMVVGGEEASHLRSGLEGYRLVSAEEILAQKKASSLEELGSEDDPAFLIYTSGTTGKPKGVVLTHFNVIHSLFHYREVFGTSPDDRTLVAVPLFHVTGLIGQLLHMVLVGGSSVLLPRYQTDPAGGLEGGFRPLRDPRDGLRVRPEGGKAPEAIRSQADYVLEAGGLSERLARYREEVERVRLWQHPGLKVEGLSLEGVRVEEVSF
jgi:hypothetical protein